MIYYHDFLTGVREYAACGKANMYPEIDRCPCCQAMNRLQRHGFYERYALEDQEIYRITICRLKCPDCKKTVSILPVFLLPYFQYTLDCILRFLLAFFVSNVTLCTRQLRHFYEKRYAHKRTDIELFFREQGHQGRWPSTQNEKAIILLQMIQALGKAAFIRRWSGHRVSSLMAHSLYHGTLIVKMK